MKLPTLAALALGSLSTLAAAQEPTPVEVAPATAVGGDLPICNAGPIQFIDCNGPITMVQLDGTGSMDPTGGSLTYRWEVRCPGASFDDPTSATPILFLDVGARCFFECGAIRLVVSNSAGSSSCSTAVVVQDLTPPEIECPPDVTVGAGDPTDPSATGTATAIDACNPAPFVDYSDVVVGNVITRTWTADDGCHEASCQQIITIEEPPAGDPELDIKPGSCPNPLNTGSNGVLPVSLLGTAGFDVTDVDLATLVLGRADGVGGTVAPTQIQIADTGTPFEGEGCDCHELTGDGILDVSLKFKRQDVVAALQLEQEPAFSYLPLRLSGTLLDGTPFSAEDCIRVQH